MASVSRPLTGKDLSGSPGEDLSGSPEMSPEAAPPPLDDDWAGDPGLVAYYRKLVVRAEIDEWAAGPEPDDEPPKSLADDDAEKKFHDAVNELSTGAIERARDGAKFIETAAAALVTLYTGILGFVFVAADKPMPARGVYAAVFLGIAIVGSASYLAFIRVIPPIGRVTYTTSRPENLWRRTEWLSVWTAHLAGARAGAMRGAVVALAFGVAFMPAAFLPAAIPVPLRPIVTEKPTPIPTWPIPEPGVLDPNLAKVLYKAQVSEVASQRSESGTASASGGINSNTLVFILFWVALAVILVVAKGG